MVETCFIPPVFLWNFLTKFSVSLPKHGFYGLHFELGQDDRVYSPYFFQCIRFVFSEAPFFCSLVHQDCDKFWDLNYKEQCNGPCTGWWGEDFGCFCCVMGWVGPKVGGSTSIQKSQDIWSDQCLFQFTDVAWLKMFLSGWGEICQLLVLENGHFTPSCFADEVQGMGYFF